MTWTIWLDPAVLSVLLWVAVAMFVATGTEFIAYSVVVANDL